jgi:hypothetical protein
MTCAEHIAPAAARSRRCTAIASAEEEKCLIVRIPDLGPAFLNNNTGVHLK